LSHADPTPVHPKPRRRGGQPALFRHERGASTQGARSQTGPGKSIDVLVIGAGLSGLNSALLLEELGATVQVIEARQRIGGRVYTLSKLPGYPEVGGNGFAAGYGRVFDQAKKLGLPLLDSTPRRTKHPKMELCWTG
jgi:monoamine oxidase